MSKSESENTNDFDYLSLLDTEYLNDDIHFFPNSTENWFLPPLFKEAKSGKIMIWVIGFVDSNLIVYQGLRNHKIQKSTVEVKTNKSNRTLQEQAILEAKHKFSLKQGSGYRTLKYKDQKIFTGMKGNTFVLGQELNYPVYVQRKYDGIRMLVEIKEDKWIKMSYGNKIWNHLDDIFDNDLYLFTKALQKKIKVIDGFTLDGELYNHELEFQKITSIVKTFETQHKDINLLKYYIYDFYDPLLNRPFEERYDILMSCYNEFYSLSKKSKNKLDVVESDFAENEEELLMYHDIYVKEKYEGIMIKNISNGSLPGSKEYESSLYFKGRTNNILKFKQFFDEEVEIVDVMEGKGKDKGAAIFVVKNSQNKIFNVRMKGSIEQRKNWFKNPKEVLGRIITVKYQELSNKGIPRFAVGVAFRDYE